MTMTSDLVPLPEHLKTCGCRLAPTTHATTCRAAIEFDSIPLTERAEYEPGRRFAAISWDFPLRISGSINVDVRLDPVAVIRQHQDDYESFEMDSGYADWEKPVQFICHLINEQLEDLDVWFGSRRMSRNDTYVDELREHPEWTAADTERLEASLGPKVDPNQGTLI